jgi:1,4-dihydroxy-2-naphthoate octaprenyltransferase
MIGAFSVIPVIVGTALAWMATRHPQHQEILQTLGGILLIAGFALLGYSLECVFCRP